MKYRTHSAMETKENTGLEFYRMMGKLFYAIASADKVVRKSEYNALIQIVNSNWIQLDEYEDEYHTDAAYQIEIVFGWLDYNKMDAEECFTEFEDYLKTHNNLFSEERKRLIWQTANKIASSFSGKNKSELILLTKLKLILDK